MSTLKQYFEGLCNLIWPPHCAVCGTLLGVGEEFVCTECRNQSPLTDFAGQYGNPLEERFWGIYRIEQAATLFWFTEGSGWRDMIHRFKYNGEWRLAEKLGAWLGAELKHSQRFDEVDMIIPVPLHWAKRLWRGYNQSEIIARGIASRLGVPMRARALCRTRFTRSQTTKLATERWGNVSGIFKVRKAEQLRGHHILLVDDVFTTGATISACIAALNHACEGDIRISVATLSMTRHEEP